MQPDPLKALGNAIAGLTFPSESDIPFDVVDWPSLALPAGKVTELSPAEFFQPLKSSDDAERFELLHQTLDRLVHPLRVYRVDNGTAEVQFFLIGNDANGRLLGVHTVSIET